MRRIAIQVGLVFVAMLALTACHQNGTVFTVDTGADAVDDNPGDGLCADAGGDCTLRAAVMEANALAGVEEIRFEPGVTDVTLSIAGKNEDGSTVGDLDILEGVVINGPVRIDGTGAGRIFDLHHTAGLVELDQLDIFNGNETLGVGLRVRGGGHVLVTNSDFHDHDADTTVMDLGGGGIAWISNSSFYANTGAGGSISNRGMQMRLTNVTVAENNTFGPSVWTLAGDVISHSTIADNRIGLTGYATVIDSIIADNTVSDCLGFDTALVSGGGNLESGTDCGFTEPTDLQNTDPRLLPGFDAPQTVRTLRISATSPARDHIATIGGSCRVPVDAIETARPTGAACDIGAIELISGPGCADPANGGAYLCDLAGIDLAGVVMNFLDFSGTDFTGADLDGAESMITDFTATDLTGAMLTGGNFNGSTFDRIAATNADFTGSLLQSTAWGATDLHNADFTDANLFGATLGDADLSGVTWSNTVCPSGVNSDTNGNSCTGQL